jgi:hypothetical protein
MRLVRRVVRWSAIVAFIAFAPLTAMHHAQAAEPAPITTEQALDAYDRFIAAPEANLKDATVFLRFMQSGAVHTVLSSKLLFWMYRDVQPDVQAVLYAAYMGGNLDSQLRTMRHGDDPVAGMRVALQVYLELKRTHPGLALSEFESLEQAAHEDRFAAAVTTLGGLGP